eukprot:488585_1
MTYNILADGTTYALSSHHEYCDIQYRNWQHRGPRILLKFKAYNPDIICMQEITLTLYNEYFKSEMKKLGYIGVYGRRNNASDEIQDDCIWIKTDKIKIIKSKVIRLGNPSKQDSNHKNNFICESDEIRDLGRNKNCYFFRQLENCWDVFIVVFCQLKSHPNKRFIVCSTHLYWNPNYPQIKVGQSYLFNYRLHKLLTEVWNIKDINEIPIVLGIDSNALPYKDYIDKYTKQLPENGYLVSGVYTFMTEGILCESHFEHPSMHYKTLSLPDWKLPFDWKWKSVYNIVSLHKYNNNEPYLTNCVPTFQGCIDYLFINDNFKVLKYVEMPWQSNLRYHLNNNDLNEKETNSEIETEKQLAKTFAPCPNESYPSDHLLLCATLML